LRLFLEKLIDGIKKRESGVNSFSLDQVMKWNRLIRESWVMNSLYNQSRQSLLESLFLRMRDSLYEIDRVSSRL